MRPAGAEESAKSDPRPRIWPWVFALAAGVAAARLGAAAAAGWSALGVGALLLVAGLAAGLAAGRRPRALVPALVPTFALAGACLVCAGIGLLRADAVGSRLPADSVLRFAGAEPRLLRVRAVAVSDAAPAAAAGGAFAPFAHRAPTREFRAEVAQVETDRGARPASGLLAVSWQAPDGAAPVRAGDPVTMLGWLKEPAAPGNPGEFDLAEHWRRQGVAARFAAGGVAVGSGSEGFSLAGSWHALRARSAQAAEDSLRHGLRPGPATTLAAALLLGVREGEGSAELWQDFQRAGLAHVLAISGANVGVFLLGVWWLGRLLSGKPGRVACAVLAVVGAFLLMVPDDTPVLRAGLMAAFLAGAYGLGRPVSGLFALGAAAFVLLLLRPMELFAPGFQLSFAAVGALLLFVRPIAARIEAKMAGDLPIESASPPSPARRFRRACLRLAVEGAVAGVVVFLAVLPVLACHYDAVNPLAALFSLAAAPVATLLMWVGYAKVALGLAWAPLGALLAWPVEGLAGALAWVVHACAGLPGAQWALVKPASPAVAAAAGALIWGMLWMWSRRETPEKSRDREGAGTVPLPHAEATMPMGPLPHGRGSFPERLRLPSVALLSLAFGLLFAEQYFAWQALRGRPGLRLHEAAVGDGSCILLETRDKAVLFDCGSRTLARPGLRVAVPALRRLGVRSLDAVVVSHADLDHFGGLLDVADAFPVKAAYLGPSVWDDAAAEPKGACAVLLAGLRERGIPCLPVSRGWTMDLGPQAQVQALWPAADFPADRADNDRGVVLRATCPRTGERALLCADLEDKGMRGLFAAESDLSAKVADLPHHGGFVQSSPDWLEKVAPRTVIQSSSRERADSDLSRQWLPFLEQAQVEHRVTGRDGLVTVELGGK